MRIFSEQELIKLAEPISKKLFEEHGIDKEEEFLPLETIGEIILKTVVLLGEKINCEKLASLGVDIQDTEDEMDPDIVHLRLQLQEECHFHEMQLYCFCVKTGNGKH